MVYYAKSAISFAFMAIMGMLALKVAALGVWDSYWLFPALWVIAASFAYCGVYWARQDAGDTYDMYDYKRINVTSSPTKVVTTHTTKMRSGPGAPPPTTTARVDYE